MPWDIFLAHASADMPTARALHDALVAAGRRVFLDAVVLKPGDIWARELARAQRTSRVTLALWSRKTDAAWFLQEEVQTALAMCRAPGGEHRLIVVFGDGRPAPARTHSTARASCTAWTCRRSAWRAWWGRSSGCLRRRCRCSARHPRLTQTDTPRTTCSARSFRGSSTSWWASTSRPSPTSSRNRRPRA